MASKGLGSVVELQRPWQGVGPFIFASHHVDAYPAAAKGTMGPPKEALKGRNIGMDMRNESGTGWNMYHGDTVPGFPAHPHTGFETVSIVGDGIVDHADSLGAGARYGKGDVQWVTTGKGVVHSEMFPMLKDDAPNPFELYQLWLNLPAAKKRVPAEFQMQWDEKIPTVRRETGQGCASVRVIAGSFDGTDPIPPPSNSYAAEKEADVAIWMISMEPRSAIKLPAMNTDKTERMLYVHNGGAVSIDGQTVTDGNGFKQTKNDRLTITNGPRHSTIMVLQGVPIDEPYVQRGPFVTNSEQELNQAFAEYQRTRFGGWPWDSDQPVYPRDEPRFAIHGKGQQKEYPTDM